MQTKKIKIRFGLLAISLLILFGISNSLRAQDLKWIVIGETQSISMITVPKWKMKTVSIF